jgi:metal-sulfur cluster biosynthetic enzyme
MNSLRQGWEDEVWARLDRVTDPELDEPVTSLGFVTSVAVQGDHVHVGFRLPTYWCAANFAFLMADDIRREVLALPWVHGVTVELGEHMYAETINAGLRESRSFRETFGVDASEDLAELRRTFARKSFQRRQEQLLQGLLGAGHAATALVAMSVADLRAVAADADLAGSIERYLQRRGEAGEFDAASPAFVDEAGRPLSAAALGGHLRRLRSVTVNMEFNGALCRGLLAARFGEEQPEDQGAELRHFVRQAARELR